ncbi:MAG: ATP synthase F1 subunit delta [bacterium]|nr:MAG: ATP synthase F1 subunit delta [bacterium]
MIGFVLARRYAKAIIDLAVEADLLAEIGEDLNTIAGLFARSPELVNVFSDPTYGADAKEKVLAGVLEKGGVQDLTMRFIGVLLRKNRILGIGQIASAYRDFADQMSNRIRARVVSAVELQEDEVARMKKVLSDMSGKDVILEMEVDPSLLGGVVAYMGSQVFDGSLKNQLVQIKDTLSKGR